MMSQKIVNKCVDNEKFAGSKEYIESIVPKFDAVFDRQDMIKNATKEYLDQL